LILAVDDDTECLRSIQSALGKDFDLLTARSVQDAEALLRNREVKVLVCADTMSGETGIMFMARIQHEFPFTRRILLTGDIDPDVLMHAVNETGLHRFLTKPFQIEELRRQVERGVAEYLEARQSVTALRENERLRQEIEHARHQSENDSSTGRQLKGMLRLLIMGSVVLGILFLLGLLALLTLYVLKSFLGIDIFKDVHFKDLF